MSDRVVRFVWKSLVTVALAALFSLGGANAAHADDVEIVIARATGQIISQAPCGPTHICQVAIVSGRSTVLGKLTGVLNERVDISTGNYDGTAVFTGQSGGTVNTSYIGFVTPPDASGNVAFVEDHDVHGGTGEFTGVSGKLGVLGTATGTGALSIIGLGYVVR
jgi:hypothetical protein